MSVTIEINALTAMHVQHHLEVLGHQYGQQGNDEEPWPTWMSRQDVQKQWSEYRGWYLDQWEHHLPEEPEAEASLSQVLEWLAHVLDNAVLKAVNDS